MFSRLRRFRVTAWLAIAGYVLIASGLPLPFGIVAPRDNAATTSRLAAKDRSQPFPCMDKPCGCATAEQCFKNCCCHTPTERLAWAKAHRVELTVLVALERLAATPRSDRSPPGHGTKNCCKKSQKLHLDLNGPDVCRAYRSFASAAPAATTPEPAATTRPDSDPSGDEGSAPTEPRPRRSLSLRAMLACGGIVAEWLTASVAVPVCSVELTFAQEASLESRLLADDFAESGHLPPDVPPPRA